MVELRRAVPTDAETVSRLLAESFAELRAEYTAAAFAATVIGPEEAAHRMTEGPVWICFLDGEAVATGSVVVRGDGLYVRGMAVVPRARGRRVGWRLLEVMEEFARRRRLARMYLSTTPFLDRAIRLYERCGFGRTDEPPHEMLGTPLFTMTKRVASSAVDAADLPDT